MWNIPDLNCGHAICHVVSANFLLCSLKYNSRVVHTGFVVDKVTLGHVFLRVLQFKLASYKLQYQETNLVTFSNLYNCY